MALGHSLLKLCAYLSKRYISVVVQMCWKCYISKITPPFSIRRPCTVSQASPTMTGLSFTDPTSISPAFRLWDVRCPSVPLTLHSVQLYFCVVASATSLLKACLSLPFLKTPFRGSSRVFLSAKAPLFYSTHLPHGYLAFHQPLLSRLVIHTHWAIHYRLSCEKENVLGLQSQKP